MSFISQRSLVPLHVYLTHLLQRAHRVLRAMAADCAGEILATAVSLSTCLWT
jgi:hypothetical protein